MELVGIGSVINRVYKAILKKIVLKKVLPVMARADLQTHVSLTDPV